jgi:hypothetical protein
MALTKMESKVIDHCVTRLKAIDTQSVFSFVFNNGLISGSDEEKRAFYNTLSDKLREHVNSRVSDVTNWLTTLIEQ